MDRRFGINTILTVWSGILLCDMNTAHEDIERMAGFSVWTHQIPRVLGELKTELVKHLPWLEGVEVPEGMDAKAVKSFVIESASRYGEWHELPVLLPEIAEREPVSEAVAMKGGAENVVVTEIRQVRAPV